MRLAMTEIVYTIKNISLSFKIFKKIIWFISESVQTSTIVLHIHVGLCEYGVPDNNSISLFPIYYL